MGFDNKAAQQNNEEFDDQLYGSTKSTLDEAVESEVIPTLLQLFTPGSSHIQGNIESPAAPVVSDWINSLSATLNSTTPSSTTPIIEPVLTARALPPETPKWLTPGTFVLLLLDDDEDLAMNHVAELRSEGVEDEVLLLCLLAPTSAELGLRWEEDLSNFADVTLGVCRLHRILRSLHPTHERTLDNSAHGGRVLLTPAVEEQHSFGLLLVGELLFRAGWYTDLHLDPSGPSLPTTLARNWYEMVGISVSCESRLSNVANLIKSVKKNSINRDVKILVGGRVFSEDKELGYSLGADQVISEGAEVAAIATQYIPTQSRL